MSRKLNQDLEDRCNELQDARDQVAGLENRLQEARIQKQEAVNRSVKHASVPQHALLLACVAPVRLSAFAGEFEVQICLVSFVLRR